MQAQQAQQAQQPTPKPREDAQNGAGPSAAADEAAERVEDLEPAGTADENPWAAWARQHAACSRAAEVRLLADLGPRTGKAGD